MRARSRDRLRLHVECGSGTYVRSLVRDLGERLGCGAHVTALRRLWVEPFMQPAHAWRLDELAALAEADAAALDALLLPLEAGTGRLSDRSASDAAAAARLRQGQAVEWPPRRRLGRCVALDGEGRAVALVECDATAACARCAASIRCSAVRSGNRACA